MKTRAVFAIIILVLTVMIHVVDITSVDTELSKTDMLAERLAVAPLAIDFQINLEKDMSAIRDLYREENASTKRIMSAFYGLVETQQFWGIPEKEAIKSASEQMIQREALYLKAVSLGFEISDSEAREKVNDILAVAKTADNYSEFEAVRKASDISDEEFINNETELKKISGSIDAYYSHIKSNYMKAKKLSALMDSDEAWSAYWEANVQAVIKSSANLPSIRLIKSIGRSYDSAYKLLLPKPIHDTRPT